LLIRLPWAAREQKLISTYANDKLLRGHFSFSANAKPW
jgi:hypothetical protein